MKNRYNIYVNNTFVKSYPFKIQAIIYCYLKGYVYEGGCDFDNNWYRVLDPKVKILESKKCFRCGTKLEPSPIDYYTYYCPKCDEDFYSFEQ